MPTTDERIAALEAKIEQRDQQLAESSLAKKQKADRAALAKLREEAAAKKASEGRKMDTATKVVLGAGVQLVQEPIRSRIVATVLPVLTQRDRERMKPWAAMRGVDLTAAPYTAKPEAAPVSAVPLSPAATKTAAADPAATVEPSPPATGDTAVDPAAPAAPAAPAESPAPAAPSTPAADVTPEPADDPLWPATGPLPLDPILAAVMRVFRQIEPMERSMVEGVFLGTAQGEDRALMEQFFTELSKDDPQVELPVIGDDFERETAQPSNGQYSQN